MSGIFLDTVGLVALWDESDQWHAAAEQVYQDLLSKRKRLLTSTFVLLECGNGASRRPYRNAILEFSIQLHKLGLLITPNEADWREAWTAYSKGWPGDAGIIDHFSFAIMRRLNLKSAFTNDRHFRTAGFDVLF